MVVGALIIGIGIGFSLGMWPSAQTEPATLSMHGAMAGMTGELASLKGDEFDHAFLSEMIVHHEGAVEMARMLLANTERQELRDLGAAIISAQTEEIGMMRQWQEEWF